MTYVHNHEQHTRLIAALLQLNGYRIDSRGQTYINATSPSDEPVTVDVRIRRKSHARRLAEGRPHGRLH